MKNKEYLKWIMPSIKTRTVSDIEYFNFRIEKAKEQSKLSKVNREEIKKHVNDFLVFVMDMEKIDTPCVDLKKQESRRISYSAIKKKYKQKDKDDIIWIKFTTDGFISVIGTGCDIYFTDYAKKNTTAGRILQSLNKEWDDSSVFIFPLINIPKGLNRSDIESGIGNYLISKGVPILDFYSHNY